MTDVSEVLQKLILETIDRDGSIPDTRTLGSAYDQQQVLGVLKRLELYQVRQLHHFFSYLPLLVDD